VKSVDKKRIVRRSKHRFDNRSELMVPHENNVIYIHIPKTGGTSIRRSIIKDRDNSHSTAIAYRRKDPEFFSTAYKFTIVRNPLDRVVSMYHYSTQRKKKHKIFESQCFLDFCNELRDNFCRAIGPATFPQFYWITDEYGKIMVDDIFPFEHIAPAIEIVKKKTGICGDLSHTNKSHHKQFMYYHDTNTEEIIRQLYPFDFALYEESIRRWNGNNI